MFFRDSITTAYCVPERGDPVWPTDEVVEWMNTCPHYWDGDDYGITIACGTEGEHVLVGPGDWVVCIHNPDERWFVAKKDSLIGQSLLILTESFSDGVCM